MRPYQRAWFECSAKGSHHKFHNIQNYHFRCLIIGGPVMSTLPWSLEDSAVSAELKRFISEKVAQVRAERRAPEHQMGPLSQTFFIAAEKGDWRGVFDGLTAFRDCAREGLKTGVESKPQVVYPVEWAVV